MGSMYSHYFLIEFISILAVGGFVIYFAQWLPKYHPAYKRLYALIINTVLLMATVVALILGYTHNVIFFHKFQKELLVIIIFLFCFVFIQFCNLIIWNGLLIKNGRPIFPKVLVRFIHFVIFIIALFIILQCETLIYQIFHWNCQFHVGQI